MILIGIAGIVLTLLYVLDILILKTHNFSAHEIVHRDGCKYVPVRRTLFGRKLYDKYEPTSELLWEIREYIVDEDGDPIGDWTKVKFEYLFSYRTMLAWHVQNFIYNIGTKSLQKDEAQDLKAKKMLQSQ